MCVCVNERDGEREKVIQRDGEQIEEKWNCDPG